MVIIVQTAAFIGIQETGIVMEGSIVVIMIVIIFHVTDKDAFLLRSNFCCLKENS